MQDFPTFEDIKDAQRRIAPGILATSLKYSEFFSKESGAQVFLKLESEQLSGSFKIRGVFNKVLTLSDKEKAKGLITISTGNNAIALGYAAQAFGLKALVFLPKNTFEGKIDAIKKFPVTIKLIGDDLNSAEVEARKEEKRTGKIYMSPYNDAKVIAGEGTIALEILKKQPDIDIIMMSVAGGGLISGISIAAKAINPNIKIIGVQPEAVPGAYESLKTGKIVKVKLKPSIAESVQCEIEKDSITFPIMKKNVDEILLVNEDEIKNAILLFLEHHNTMAEASSVLGLAALLRYKAKFAGKKVAVIIGSGNADIKFLKSVLKI